ncbi:MAG: ribonuclease HII [Thermofilaceae archaeon]|nr:ribonuclease HII [Thermofilaceae archaeon]
MNEAGVDEAGRGSVIGPLVLACVVFDEKGIFSLKGLVKDSKELRPQARKRLYNIIKKSAIEVKVEVLQPNVIDWAVQNLERGLNDLEAMATAEILSSLKHNILTAYLDSPDPIPSRYAERVQLHLRKGDIKIVASNHAESVYPHVAAASIVAKVERDREVERLRNLYGDFGSGYPSDPKTRRYIQKVLEVDGRLPPIVRVSWRTLQRL